MSNSCSTASGPPRRLVANGRLLLPIAAAALLAGCGGGTASSPSTSSTSAGGLPAGSAQGATGGQGALGGAQRGRFRACLQAHGVTLPQRPPGQPPQAGGGLFGGGGRGRLNDPTFRKAAAACGLPPGRLGQRSPQFRARLGQFVACVRQHGYRLPPPNTTGNGPVFDATKVNRNDPKLLVAARACQPLIPRRGGVGGGTTGGQVGSPGATAPGP